MGVYLVNPAAWRPKCPRDVPGLPSTANDQRQPHPPNLKETRALNSRATHGNPLVMRRSAYPGHSQGCNLGCSSTRLQGSELRPSVCAPAFRRLGAPEDLEWERVWDGRPSPRMRSVADLGRASGLGSRSKVRWAAALLVVRASLPALPQCHLVGEALDEDRASQEEFVHGGDRSPSCGTAAPAGVPLAKGIRPLGRQCHRPSSDTASLGDEGVKGRLVHDQGRQLQEGCPAPRRGDWSALHRSADGSRGSRCANAPRARCRAASRSSPGSLRH